MKCLVCGHKWTSKVYPFMCPKCKSSNWDFGNNIPCAICERTVLNPIIHHIDGVHKNNNLKNRLPLCINCHCAIHKGFGKNGKRLRKYGVKKVYIRKTEFEGKTYSKLVFHIHTRKNSVDYDKLVKIIKNIQYYQAKLKGDKEVEKIKLFDKIDTKNKLKEKEIFKKLAKRENLNKEKLFFIKTPLINKKNDQIFKLIAQREKENYHG